MYMQVMIRMYGNYNENSKVCPICKIMPLNAFAPTCLGIKYSLERFHEELDVWLSASVCDAVVEAIHIVRINELP